MVRWETAERYYVAQIHSDLFGNRVLTKYWGGLRNRLGGMATVAVGDAAIRAALEQIFEERRAHGYRLIAGLSSHFQHPTSEVPVKTICMKSNPDSPRSTAKAIQQTLDARNSANPHPERGILRARSRAPRTPRILPDHSSQIMSMRLPQLSFPFAA